MSEVAAERRHVVYDDGVVRWFVFFSVLWGIVGLLVGVVIASQMAWWQANLGLPWTTFSRLRPLHTNAVIFALVGNMMFAGVYYSTQRLLKARMASDALSRIHLWGWQAIVVSAAVTLPLGMTTGKEYAELEWPIDLAIAAVWIVFAVNFFLTLARRNEKNLYVSLWFYIACVVTIAVLHVFNSLELPLSAFKSYSAYSGVQDALVQWWYGHNAVGFFLTTPILGIMYYFLPKAADRPVFSYRLSIVHFWALVFVYIWAGPHHLLYTALPDWAQSLGMIFSLMLWAPSWGGMLNGLLTLRGAWDKVLRDPVLKFLVAAVTFYGMATFEGPLLSIKSVSALAHYTDWIIAHVHGGALGWNGLMTAGVFYWLVPRLYGTTLHSRSAAEVHFWTATAGIVLYMASMWVSGVNQGLMWRQTDASGQLAYPNFVETLLAIRPLYMVRVLGGLLYLAGFVLMAWNLWKTARAGRATDGETDVVVETAAGAPAPGWVDVLTGRPLAFAVAAVVLSILLGFASVPVAMVVVVALLLLAVAAWLSTGDRAPSRPAWHAMLEGRPLLFTLLVLVAMLVGGVAELLPTVLVRSAPAAAARGQHPYSALELEGRDVYLREGCYTCHSQMIRPLLAEKLRYGEPSRAEESRYDHPFQWGSKRTGPDLARVAARGYPNLWHWTHLQDPRETSPGSNMPSFAWLESGRVDTEATGRKMMLMYRLGVPYRRADVLDARAHLRRQGEEIVADLARSGVTGARWDSEMVALIAYLQSLGRTTTPASAAPAAPVAGAK